MKALSFLSLRDLSLIMALVHLDLERLLLMVDLRALRDHTHKAKSSIMVAVGMNRVLLVLITSNHMQRQAVLPQLATQVVESIRPETAL